MTMSRPKQPASFGLAAGALPAGAKCFAPSLAALLAALLSACAPMPVDRSARLPSPGQGGVGPSSPAPPAESPPVPAQAPSGATGVSPRADQPGGPPTPNDRPPPPGPLRIPAPAPDDRPEAARPKWTLAWADEFDRAPCPDPANWVHERGFMRNEELQWYQSQNAFCRQGLLILEARRESVPNPNFIPGSKDWRTNRPFAEYTAASLTTEGRQQWQYGRIDVRARVDVGNGIWPAIWTLGGVWPRSHGEIDIMDLLGRRLVIGLHWPGNSRTRTVDNVPIGDPIWAGRFHVWRLEWSPDRVEFFVDGQRIGTFDTTGPRDPEGANPFQQPHHLRLNVAVGGVSGNPASSNFPARMEVDYVRVYRAELTGD